MTTGGLTLMSRNPEGRIDLAVDRPRLFLYLLSCSTFLGIGTAALICRPSSRRFDVSPGSYGEFVMVASALFFGALAVVILRALLRTGPGLSFGPRGILAPNLAWDWIAWSAIRSAQCTDSWLILRFDEAQAPELPLRWRARLWAWLWAWLNARIGQPGHHISTVGIRGGADALERALRQTAPARIA